MSRKEKRWEYIWEIQQPTTQSPTERTPSLGYNKTGQFMQPKALFSSSLSPSFSPSQSMTRSASPFIDSPFSCLVAPDYRRRHKSVTSKTFIIFGRHTLAHIPIQSRHLYLVRFLFLPWKQLISF